MKIIKRLILITLILVINSVLLQNKIKNIKEKYYQIGILSKPEKKNDELRIKSKNATEQIKKESNLSSIVFNDINQEFEKKNDDLNNLKNVVNNVSKINSTNQEISDLETERTQLNNDILNQQVIIKNQEKQISNLNKEILDRFEPDLYELNNLTNKKHFHLVDVSNNYYLMLKIFEGKLVLSSINDIKKKLNKEKTIFQLFKDDKDLDYMYDSKNIPISNYSYNDNYVLSNEKHGYLRLDNNNTVFLLFEKGSRLKLIPVSNKNKNLSIKNGDKFKIAHIKKNNDKISKNFLTYNNNLNQYVFSNNNLTPSIFKFEFINN
jgi:hypothetical protein